MTETKGIIKCKKTKNYSIISNQCFRDKTMSLKAMGLFAYLMTLPETWQVHQSELVRHFKDGRDSIASAMKELEAAGFIIKTKDRNDKGQILGTIYTVIEEPNGKPETVYPETDTPKLEKPTLLSTNTILSTDKVNTNTVPDKSGGVIYDTKISEFYNHVTNKSKMKLSRKDYFICKSIIIKLNGDSDRAIKLYNAVSDNSKWRKCAGLALFSASLPAIILEFEAQESGLDILLREADDRENKEV